LIQMREHRLELRREHLPDGLHRGHTTPRRAVLGSYGLFFCRPQLLPDHEQASLDERWMMVMTTTVHTLARYQTAARISREPLPSHELLENLVSFLAAGLESAPRQHATNEIAPSART
ncbi:hypothetical protein AB1484_29250, partial [Parafrankia sp. FMc6]